MNRLEAVQQILLRCGVRPEETSDQPDSPTDMQRGFYSLKSALAALESVGSLPFLDRYEVASLWNTDEATLNSDKVMRVVDVRVQNSLSQHVSCVFSNKEAFRLHPPEPFDNHLCLPWHIRWTWEGQNTVRCRPYPNTPETQALIYFRYTVGIPIPANDAALVDVPEIYEDALIHKACYNFCVDYLGDGGMNLAAHHQGEFEAQIQRLRSYRQAPPLNLSRFIDDYPAHRVRR